MWGRIERGSVSFLSHELRGPVPHALGFSLLYRTVVPYAWKSVSFSWTFFVSDEPEVIGAESAREKDFRLVDAVVLRQLRDVSGI